jgi:oligogalacturonide lyase
MLFVSDRDNARNLFSIEIESGEISRLTDMPPEKAALRCPMHVNRVLNETYYQYNGCVYAINLSTLETRPLYIVPRGFNFGGARPTGDGKYVVAGLSEDLSGTIKANLAAGYIGFRDIFAAKPDCRIVRINLENNAVDEVWREKCWVGHVNPSLTRGNLLTFCHEGPWQLVDHRIWMLDLDTGKAVKFRERRVEGEMVGHEYWFADGEHVGYQVHRHEGEGQVSYFGFARYDGTGEVEAPAVRVPGPDHVHSVGFDFVVSDTGKSIKGYKYNGSSFDGPRVITMHDGSFDWGAHHPHPSVTRDGKSVVYNSTAAGYCNIYMTAIPADFYALPPLEIKGKEN